MVIKDLQINADRLWSNLNELGRIGMTDEGGVSRPAMSPSDVLGRTWFRQRIHQVGLVYKEDGAGNQAAMLPSNNPHAQTVIMGSHLDTVPNGGHFDGALGVLSAFEALVTLKEAGIKLPYHLEAISLTDEEGSVYTMMGSRAIVGQITPSDMQGLPNQEAFEAGLKRLGLTKASVLNAKRTTEEIRAYVEVHIEQATGIEDHGCQIGIVTSIVGKRNFNLHFIGAAAHSGTKPMLERQDALWAASTFILDARELVINRFSPGVMNCGVLEIDHAAQNSVPSDVMLGLEFRHGREDLLNAMEDQLLALAHTCGRKFNVDVEWFKINHATPSIMDKDLIIRCEQSAAKLGLAHMRCLSMAGHDAQIMCDGFPTVMFFVPCEAGISHNPAEFASFADVANAGNMLLEIACTFAEG